MISQELLNELKDIIKEDYGIDLQIPAISEIANTLVCSFDLLAKIHHRDKQIQNKNLFEKSDALL